MRPRIGIPRWRAPTEERTRHYLDSVRRGGGEPILLDPKAEASPEQQIEAVHGLLLTGGTDVDPRLYGQKRHPETERPHRQRDAHELRLLHQALKRDLPVLAICRGHQLLNVALGGQLLQHIAGDHHRAQGDGESRWHQVNLMAWGRLARIYAGARTLHVNSRHHQAITADRLAPALQLVAVSPDGFIEAVESEAHRWVMGVQWHPERPEMYPASHPLFAAFVDACRR